MKTLKKVTMALALALTLTLVVPTVSFTNQTNTVEAATKAKVKINKTKATITKGKKANLKVTGTKLKVTWSSNKKSVATVTSKGVVTAKKAGTATITAKVGKKKFTCKVTVKNPVTKTAAKTTTTSNAKTTTKPKTDDKGRIIVPNPYDKEVGENDPKIYTLVDYNHDDNTPVRIYIANEGKSAITIKSEAYLDNDATDSSKSGKIYLQDFRNKVIKDSLTLEPILVDNNWEPDRVLFAPYPFDSVHVDEKSKITFTFECEGVEYTTTATNHSARNNYTKVK